MAKIVLSMFSSTYSCEQTFSAMKYVKNKMRSALTCDHTSELIKAAITSYEPDILAIANDAQAHPSHSNYFY